MHHSLATIVAGSALAVLAVAPAAPALAASPVARHGAAMQPDSSATKPVNPTNSCGGFKGNVYWSEDPITGGGYVRVWGDVWNNKCPGATQYVYLSYWLSDSVSQRYSYSIGQASYSPTANSGVDHSDFDGSENYVGIEVTVCDNYKGWHCGPPASV
jgi:hypothetical protein